MRGREGEEFRDDVVVRPPDGSPHGVGVADVGDELAHPIGKPAPS